MEELDDKANNLQNEANLFNKKAQEANRHFCLQKWKMIAFLAFIVAIVILIIVLIIVGEANKNK